MSFVRLAIASRRCGSCAQRTRPVTRSTTIAARAWTSCGRPSVDALLRLDAGGTLVERHGHPAVVGAIRAALAEARTRGRAETPDQLLAAAAALLDRPPTLRRVLNATGVIVHTNLGRAPL